MSFLEASPFNHQVAPLCGKIVSNVDLSQPFSWNNNDVVVPKPTSAGPTITKAPVQPFSRKPGHVAPASRIYKPIYKPKSTRGRRGGPINRNMTLNNNRRPYQSVSHHASGPTYILILSHRSRRTSNKRKYSDKPCPRFTTTGAPPSYFKVNSPFESCVRGFPSPNFVL